MKLIPEQYLLLEEEIEKERQRQNTLKEQKENIRTHTTGDGETNEAHNYEEKEAIQESSNRIKEYNWVLQTAERVKTIPVDKIGLGTKFVLQFTGEEELEKYTLVDTKIGHIGQNGYISSDSILGQVLLGKKVNDNFSYKVEVANSEKREIEGEVVDIITDRNEYINYITSREISCRKAQKLRGTPAGRQPEIFPLTKSQYELLNEESKNLLTAIQKVQQKETQIDLGSKVTISYEDGTSQVYTIVDKQEPELDKEVEIDIDSKLADILLHTKKQEKFKYIYKEPGQKKRKQRTGKLEEIDNTALYSEEERQQQLNSLYSKLAYVNKMLKNSKLAEPPQDDTIGIGSHVSIMTFTKEKTETRRVEVIQQAVSYELEPTYVEAISPLGVQLLGLKNNEGFVYRKNGISVTGIVYDIDNTKQASRTTTLNYQKSKVKK